MPIAKPTPVIYCETCGKQIERKILGNTGKLEKLGRFSRRRFCDVKCAGIDRRSDEPLSDSWVTVHKYSKRAVPPGPCSICGKADGCDVHHIDGNHKNNDLSNLTRLCRRCHLRQHRTRTFCTICGLPAKGRGLCKAHYQKARTAAGGFTPKVYPKECSICGDKVEAHGLCRSHYQAKRREADKAAQLRPFKGGRSAPDGTSSR